MKARMHRGSLDDSLATEIEITDSMDGVMEYLKAQWSDVLPDEMLILENVAVDYYGYDHRIEQDVYFVTLGSMCPAALLDGVPSDYVAKGALPHAFR